MYDVVYGVCPTVVPNVLKYSCILVLCRYLYLYSVCIGVLVYFIVCAQTKDPPKVRAPTIMFIVIGSGKHPPTDPRALPSAGRRIGKAQTVIGRSEKQNSSFDLFLSATKQVNKTDIGGERKTK